MVRLTLRLPEQLNELLEKSAREDERSKNAQIVYILRSFLFREVDGGVSLRSIPDEKKDDAIYDGSIPFYRKDKE